MQESSNDSQPRCASEPKRETNCDQKSQRIFKRKYECIKRAKISANAMFLAQNDIKHYGFRWCKFYEVTNTHQTVLEWISQNGSTVEKTNEWYEWNSTLDISMQSFKHR